MKVKVIVSHAHDTTLGKTYDTIGSPDWHKYEDNHKEVWIIDDVGDEYILLDGEYEIVVDEYFRIEKEKLEKRITELEIRINILECNFAHTKVVDQSYWQQQPLFHHPMKTTGVDESLTNITCGKSGEAR